jgi:hypothetical protein
MTTMVQGKFLLSFRPDQELRDGIQAGPLLIDPMLKFSIVELTKICTRIQGSSKWNDDSSHHICQLCSTTLQPTHGLRFKAVEK